MSVDRSFIAYTADPAHQPEICISDDGGHTFFPHALDVPATAIDFPSTGVAFTSRMNGIAWFAHPTGGKYVKRTIDGGVTWANGALPSEVTSSALELPAGFFAPDGLHGWLAGYEATPRSSSRRPTVARPGRRSPASALRSMRHTATSCTAGSPSMRRTCGSAALAAC